MSAMHPGAVPQVGAMWMSIAELVKDASDLHDPNPVDAEHVYQQLLANYPPDSVSWVRDIPWIGPIEIPLDRIDWDGKDSWAASHQKKRVKRFVKRIHNGGEDVHPIVGVQVPGDDRVKVIDGHHRALAYQEEGKPVKAYVGFAPSNDSDSPWFQAHLYQKKKGANPANKSFNPDQLRDEHGWWARKPGGGGRRRGDNGGDLRSRLGRCYELSGHYVMDHPGSTLVHGSIQGMGNPRIGHAWAITKDGRVWEPATNQEYSPVVFNAVFNPKEDKRYPWGDALEQMTKHGTFGPWNDVTKRVSFNSLELLVDEDTSTGHTAAKQYIIVPVGEVSLLQKHFNPLELRDAHGKWTGESAAKEVSQAYSDARVFGNAPQLVRDGRVHDAADEVDEKASQARDDKHAHRLRDLAARLRTAPVADESYIHRTEQEAGFTEPDPGTLVSAQSKSNDDLERDLGFRPPEKNYDFQWTHGVDPEKAEAARRELMNRAILGEYRPPPKLFPATMHAESLAQAQAALAGLQAQWRKVSRNYIPEGARTTKKPKVAKADELAQKIHGDIWPLFGEYTLAGKLKVSVADLMKVGPEGYIHGWICVRPPCGENHKQARFDSGKGTVHHGEDDAKIGKMRKNADGTYSMSYHPTDAPGGYLPTKLTARYSSRKDAAESIALYHNMYRLEREAMEDNGYDSMVRREINDAKNALGAGQTDFAIIHLDKAAGWEKSTRYDSNNSAKLLSHIDDLKKAIEDGPKPVPDAPPPENAVKLAGNVSGYARVGEYSRERGNTVLRGGFGDRSIGKDVAKVPGDAGFKIRFRDLQGLHETLEGQYATREDATEAVVAYHNISRMYGSLQAASGFKRDKISRALKSAKESLSDGNHEEAVKYLRLAEESAEDQNNDTYASHIADTIQRLESANKPVFAPKLRADSFPGDTEPMRLANNVKVYDHSEGQLRNPALAMASIRLHLLKQATFSPATVKNIAKIEITPKMSSKNALGVHRGEFGATNLEIHPSVFDATAPDVLRQGVDSGWWVPVGRDDTLIDSVLSHEVGHGVAFKAFGGTLGYPASRDFWSKFTAIANAQPLKSGSVRHLMKVPKGTTPGVLPSEMNAWVKDNKETLAGDVSTYGASDVHELQAELWSEYTSNPNPRPLATFYGDYVVNHMKNMGYE